ncbi:tetratricopeptide repeat protein [Rummeliibacillus pycnus]|uniref:tetratricopeptide repeat protein n=1 Tax=Rummeliibacillus pycnus TaxID=101070 RepID=UPI003D28AB26
MEIEKLKIAFNKLSDYIFFDENQCFREQVSSIQQIKKFIEDTEPMIQFSLKNDEKYFLYSVLGYAYRVINQAEQAIFYFQECITLTERNPKLKMITLIRLGEAYKYANLHKEALELFDHALKLSIEFNMTNYDDFIYQHKGKCLMEMGEIELAKKYLNTALKIRKRKGNIELIKSTQIVLDYLNNGSVKGKC